MTPRDEWAETVCVGLAIDSPAGAASVAELDVTDFIDPELARLWLAAQRCPVPYRASGLRTRAVARAAGVSPLVAEDLRAMAPVLFDNGRYVARVRDATVRRRVLAEVLNLARALEARATLAEVVPVLERALAVARGEHVGVVAEAARAMRGWAA